MPVTPDDTALAALLPGTWRVGATNISRWLGGERLHPRFHYELRSSDPLVFEDEVRYTTGSGVEKRIRGVDRLRARASGADESGPRGFRPHEFVWRGRGLRTLASRRFSVAGATEGSTIVVLRFSASLRTPAGVAVVVRDGTDSHAFRTEVAGLSESLGLTPGEFASLTWLELSDSD